MINRVIDKTLNKITDSLSFLKDKDVNYWTKLGEREMIRSFREASERVPAYKEFLKKNKINPQNIKTIEDFKLLPTISKDSYIRKYSYDMITRDGGFNKPRTIHSTSGSTGDPTYFQRDFKSDLKRELILKNFFNYNDDTIAGPTLMIITFSMGVWSAGMGIYTAAYLSTNFNNYPISIVSPGINKVEVLKILKNIAPNFRQVIIAGYPPFIKDIIDDAIQDGINIKKFNTRFIFTGEAFTEEFRTYIYNKTKISNILTDTMNTYGTSELGAVAVETPLTILTRRILNKNKNILKQLFYDDNKIPTLAQYVPSFVNFECIDGELFFTGDDVIPLIRYQSGDSGGVLTFQKLKEVLAINSIDLDEECNKVGISKYIYKLPLVYVYERKNLTVTLYGILIYPEFIKSALLTNQLNSFLTGKFMMTTKYTKNQDQYIEVNLEMKKGVNFKNAYKKIATDKILEVLKKKSSEFNELYKNLGKKVDPQLLFWPYEYQEYFKPGTKQKWVNNN